MGGAQDIVSRIVDFLKTADPMFVLAGLTGLLVIAGLAAFRKTLVLFFLLLMTLTLQAASLPAIDKASSLGRFFMIFLMAAHVLALRTNPGKALWLFGGYIAIGLAFTGKSANPMFAIQWGGLTCATWTACVALTEFVPTRETAARMCVSFLFCAAFWAVLGVLSLRSLASETEGGGRFAGYFTSAGIFVQTGGLLLPFAVWGAMRPWARHWQIACGTLALTMALVLLSSGQRTGTFAGVIASSPLLVRRRFGKVLLMGIAAGAFCLVVYKLASVNSRQTEFIVSRFTSTSTTHRSAIWEAGLEEIISDPFLGKGFGSNRVFRELIKNTLHNMYLSVWYDTGLFGLMCFVAAGVVAGWQAFVLSLKARHPETNEMARLMLGIIGSSAAAGMFATGASSPSDFATCGLLIAMVLTSRLKAINVQDSAGAAAPTPQQLWQYQQLVQSGAWPAYGYPQYHAPQPAPYGR